MARGLIAGAACLLIAACSTATTEARSTATTADSTPAATTADSTPAATPVPAGGISRDRAIAIARQQFGSLQVTLVSAEVGEWRKFAPNWSANGSYPTELVWAITFSGRFVHPCPAGVQCNPSTLATELLDFKTGVVLGGYDSG